MRLRTGQSSRKHESELHENCAGRGIEPGDHWHSRRELTRYTNTLNKGVCVNEDSARADVTVRLRKGPQHVY